MRLLPRPHFVAILAIIVAGLSAATPASAKLTASYIRDGQRVCVYDDIRGNYTNPAARSLTLDRNEECPASPAPPVVPALATLDSSSVVGGKKLCVYGYAGRSYIVPVDVGMNCTYTPR